MFVPLLAAFLFLAYANGANDNFKGVATLFGTGNAGYRTAFKVHRSSIFRDVVTGMLVLFASRVGIPVSTTHVAVGALFGAGVANGQLNRRVLVQIGSAWLLTLPLAGGLAALLFAVFEAY